MYYAEQTINGVLCFKNTPDGAWIPYSPEALTIMLNGAKARIEALKIFINETKPITDDLSNTTLFNGQPEVDRQIEEEREAHLTSKYKNDE